MRIGLILPSIYMYPKYGGGRIFAPGDLASKLADGLVEKGHEVNFYTAPDFPTKANLIPGDKSLLDGDLSYFIIRNRSDDEKKYVEEEVLKRDYELPLVLKAYQDAREGKLDIIHNYHDFGAHYLDEFTHFPTVYTLHDPMPPQSTIEYHRLSKFAHHNYISISDAQRRGMKLNFVQTIYHGVDFSDYEYGNGEEGYLIFFGRMIEDKGPHIAIDVAKRMNMNLKIASSFVSANTSETYYQEKVKPHVDEKQICEVGFMRGKEKSDFIGRSKAFLFPLQWEEPFGMVLIESMACGTPVIAYNRGSIPEIVKDGITGFVIDPDEEDRPGKGTFAIKKKGTDGLMEALSRIGEIDRKNCREYVKEKFGIEKMVENHERLYKQITNNR